MRGTNLGVKCSYLKDFSLAVIRFRSSADSDAQGKALPESFREWLRPVRCPFVKAKPVFTVSRTFSQPASPQEKVLFRECFYHEFYEIVRPSISPFVKAKTFSRNC